MRKPGKRYRIERQNFIRNRSIKQLNWSESQWRVAEKMLTTEHVIRRANR